MNSFCAVVIISGANHQGRCFKKIFSSLTYMLYLLLAIAKFVDNQIGPRLLVLYPTWKAWQYFDVKKQVRRGRKRYRGTFRTLSLSKIFNDFYLLTIFAKSPIIGVWLCLNTPLRYSYCFINFKRMWIRDDQV